MRQLAATIFLLLALARPAFGMCVELPVTPSSLDSYFYTFAVSTNAVTNGMAFHITITAKKRDIDTNYCSAKLETVSVQNGTAIYQEPFEAAIPVAVQKQPRKWTIDFILPHESLKSPDLNFIFWEQAVDQANGKTTPMPAGTFYEMWLMDFANPRSSSQLETPTYTITITACQEYVVSCDDVKFVCFNKKTGKTISLTGRTDHSLAADGVTPGHFLGYAFANGEAAYFVSDDGQFTITQGSKTLVDEQGTWR